MTVRFKALARKFSGIVVCAVAGCSSSDGPEVPRGPEDFAVASVTLVDSGESVTKDGGTLSSSCDTESRFLVDVSPEVTSDDYLGDFLLAAPGACGSVVSCGWIVLQAIAEDGDVKVGQVLSAKTPLAIDLPTSFKGGKVTFRASLIDSAGDEVMTDKGEPLTAELSVTLDKSCP